MKKVNTRTKLSLEKFQISKIENPLKIMGGKKKPISSDTNATTIHWPDL